MLNFDTAVELMKKYGYSSTSVHPYLYLHGENLGICYSYYDEDYGLLERIKILNDEEEFEEFLKQLNWTQNNGKDYHVRMILDNYESINPKTIYLRNEKIMVEGEMFDIDNFDKREVQRNNMDPVSKVIFECGDLLLTYNEIKGRQLQYLKNIVALKNDMRQRYYDLQKEVDKYNKIRIERHLTLMPEVADLGINETMEMSVKDKYNTYINHLPDMDEAMDFLSEVWELNRILERNKKYYEAIKEETDIRNELKVVDAKMELMNELNDNVKPLFGIDLCGRFRKINAKCKKESTEISDKYIGEMLNNIERKYSYYNEIDPLFTSDYLKEAIQNTNYKELAHKYKKGAQLDIFKSVKTPPNEIAASLSIQYRDKLSVEEQSILVLYNNPKYRLICDVILDIPDFETVPVRKIISKLGKINKFSKVKSECYDVVKKRIDDPLNANLKNGLFLNFDFTSFETFITSLIKELVKLKNVNDKMVLNGDVNMYVVVNKPEDIYKERFLTVTNDLNALLEETKKSKDTIGIALLKENLPVLYSPYYFDVGDYFSKDASPQMFIKEMVNFEIMVEINDAVVNIDPIRTNVVRYKSLSRMIENVSVVDDIKSDYKTKFCKFALSRKDETVTEPIVENEETVLSTPVAEPESVSKETNPEPVESKEVVVPETQVLADIPNDKESEPSVTQEVKEEVISEDKGKEVTSVSEDNKQSVDTNKELVNEGKEEVKDEK